MSLGVLVDWALPEPITVGAPELVYTDAQLPLCNPNCAGFPDGRLGMDASFATVKVGNETSVFVSIGWGGLIKYPGTVTKPFLGPTDQSTWKRTKAQLFPDVSSLLNNTEVAAWFPSIYTTPEGNLLGFIHIEDRRLHPGIYDATTRYSIGLALSNDRGLTWHFLGEIITTKVREGDKTNIGGIPVLVVGSYFYVYFNEYVKENVPGRGLITQKKLSVARALISNVLGVANGSLAVIQSDWKKYNPSSGGWNENALTGTGANIIPPSQGTSLPEENDFHSDAVYSTVLKKYLITVSANTGLFMYSSTDGVTWKNPVVMDFTAGKSHAYSSFMSAQSTNDPNNFTIDQPSFYLFMPLSDNSTPATWLSDIYRKKITISALVPPMFKNLLN